MIRYISAILIPCLLLQLTGCYSSEYIYKDQIALFYPDEAITIKTIDQKEYVIKKDVSHKEIEDNPTIAFCSEYKIKNDTFYLLRKDLVFSNQPDENGIKTRRVMKDTVVIPSHLVTAISTREINWWTTSLLLVCVIGAIWMVAAVSTFHIGSGGSTNTTTW